MPKATILVEPAPGGGQAVADAVFGDVRVTRGFATLGTHEAVAQVDAEDHDGTLEVIQAINPVGQQIASETLLDMQVEEEAAGVRGPGGEGDCRALLLVVESKDKACHCAHTLFSRLNQIPGVEEAYPLLGRIDDAVWVRAPDLSGLTRVVDDVCQSEGVRGVQVLLEAKRNAQGAPETEV